MDDSTVLDEFLHAGVDVIPVNISHDPHQVYCRRLQRPGGEVPAADRRWSRSSKLSLDGRFGGKNPSVPLFRKG